MNHDHLLDEGWQRQTTIDEPRLSELAENYRALGYAVLIVHEAPGDAACRVCFDSAAASGRGVGGRLGTLYIRRQDDAASVDDELF